MKRTPYQRSIAQVAMMLLLALFAIGVNSAWADDITAEQALQQAQTFVKSRQYAGGRHNAPGITPQLMLACKVSGLYVFNMANGGGFVIVSNDDRTTPILGFSDSDSFEAQNMPDNMRAWLQGYADEIAWLQTHEAQSSRRPKSAPRLVGSHPTTSIPPLVSTTWNQGTPYNNLCPTYDGYSKSVTGCVATAMAQVMKYHNWPEKPKKTIPGYTTNSYYLSLSSLTADITFDWNNMKDSYLGSYTTAQATAVATLMKYCGYSVKMDYGPSSGAYTEDVADALLEYFDYKTTTQYVTRSHYTYANWTDLIYHELSQQRPVAYGGMSTGGGHEFVCDGYKYENNTDFFHINWGWGGTSDNYFVLSALDPDEQGIGGSTSTDGFHYGQDAVIGIQPSTGTGTMSDITPNTIDLSLEGISVSKSTIVPGESVTITINVKNNSSDPYDGDIMLYDEANLYNNIISKTFVIEPEETKECDFTVTLTNYGTYHFVPLRNDFYYLEYPAYSEAVVTVEDQLVELPDGLTVYEGTVTNQQVPAYIYYFDDYSRSQFVIPAADLEEMNGGTINSISFYTTNNNIPCTTASTVDVYLKEVDYTSISAFETKESSTIVYQGKLSILKAEGGVGLLTITLSDPYTYEGGNLLIGIENTTDVGYRDIYFYGQPVSGASVSGNNGNSLSGVSPTQQNFIPKTTFTYDPPTGVVVMPRPTSLACTAYTSSTATLAWTEKGTATAWQICLNGDEENLIDADSNPFTLEGLTAETTYTARVRAVGEEMVSAWSAAVSFMPSAKQVIGLGTAKNNFLPTNCYYNYSLTQQIYTSAELGEAGVIQSIDFRNASTIARARTINIYMVNTTKNTFANNSDFIEVSASDLVYSGEVTFAADAWTTIELDAPFDYDGSSNVALIIDDNTGSYSSNTDFLAFSATKQALHIYSDGINYNPYSPSGYSGTIDNTKNQIRLLKGALPSVLKPRDVTVDYTGGTTATVTWTSNEESFDIDVNGIVKENVSSPYTLADLELATTYVIKVRAKNGTDVSDWSKPVSFTTDLSYDVCSITFELTDSWGDGWNGNVIKVVDVLTGTLIGTATNTTINHSSAPITDTVVMAVPNDRDIQFVWESGQYANECSFKIFDVNGNLIYKFDSNSSGPSSGVLTTYHVDCTVIFELADGAKNNSTTIAKHDGKVADVTLNGRTLYKDGSWNTICLPFNVTLADSPLADAVAKTLVGASMEGEHVTLTFGEEVDELEAGVPYIIKWAEGQDIVNPKFEHVTIDKTMNPVSEDGGNVKFIGYYNAFDINTPANDDIYYMTGDNTLKHTGKARTLKACRAYFQFSETLTAREFILNFGEGEMTGITTTANVNPAGKTDTFYTVNGVKVDRPTRRGLYIQNGRKVVIR